MHCVAKLLGEDEAVSVNGSTVTLRRPKTTLTKQYQFSAPEYDVSAHITTALGKCESMTVLSVGAQGAGKTTTLLGVAEASIGAAFAALGAAADELVTFSALTSVVSGRHASQSKLGGT